MQSRIEGSLFPYVVWKKKGLIAGMPLDQKR